MEAVLETIWAKGRPGTNVKMQADRLHESLGLDSYVYGHSGFSWVVLIVQHICIRESWAKIGIGQIDNSIT